MNVPSLFVCTLTVIVCTAVTVSGTPAGYTYPNPAQNEVDHAGADINASGAGHEYQTVDSATQPTRYETKPGQNKAVLEYERIPSRIESKYDAGHGLLSGLLNPVPILDNIREEDKYGNEGSKIEPLLNGLASGFGSISGFVSRAFDVPFNLVLQLSRSVTGALDRIGAKVVGLA